MPQLTKNIFDDLKEKIKGDVFTDEIRRYMHSTDGSIFRVEPACVVYPTDRDDVVAAVRFAARYGLSVHSRGAGSGLCGSAVGKGIILDFAKYMNQLVKIDEENKYFICQPGYRFGELEKALGGKPLFFPPDPSSGEYASFGGMYGTNASGAHSVKYGNVSDYIVDAEVVLSDGTIFTFSEIAELEYSEMTSRFRQLYDLYDENKELIEKSYPEVRYNVNGYNLRGLAKEGKLNLGKFFGGSEGTLGVVTQLKFKLLDKPKHDSLVVAYFDNIVKSAKAVQALMPSKPAGIEVMDKSLLNLARESDEKLREAIPEGMDNVLMIEYDGYTEEEVTELAEAARKLIEEQGLAVSSYTAASEEEKEKFWAVRKAAVPILYKLKGRKKILALIEDAAVPTDKLVEYFEGLYAILGKHNADFVIYGHIAKGLLHTRPLLDLKDPHDIEMLRILADEVFELVYGLGGVVSGEHGDGRIRTKYIKKQYPELYSVFLEAKHIMDQENLLNPDIKTVYDPNQVKKYLRYGSDYGSKDLPKSCLVWDEGFAEEVEKCHGCSKCTTVTTATRMCPVYKATRDESAAPKAKANVLRALISGAVNNQAIYEEEFQAVIEKCIGCGSCAVECPSNVNIPKLAAEAKAQFNKRFGTPLENRFLAGCEFLGRSTRKFSKVMGTVMKPKTMRKAMEFVTGVTAEREFLEFSTTSLFEMTKSYKFKKSDRKVIYFAGCYATYIRPSVGMATIKVLEALGFEVILPEQGCCGVPHLTKGMSEAAKKKVEGNIQSWGHYVDSAEAIVVSCSSCGLSLTKEWEYVLKNADTEKVKNKLKHLAELVNENFDKLKFKADKKMSLAYHTPCHLKAQKSAASSINLLKKVPGVEFEDMKSNCCGMGGSWGMKSDNYELSVKIGEPMTHKLKVSSAQYGCTDCPTCTIQMEHLGGKDVKNPAEVLADMIDDKGE